MSRHDDGDDCGNGESGGGSELDDQATHAHVVRFDMGMIMKAASG
jgi:hypothetical protein